MNKWNGKNAIVTGASAGIGEAIVRDFANLGINVVALARRIEKLQNIKNELKDSKGNVTIIQCDVSDKASIDAAFKEIEEKIGIVHILVNNAGIATYSSILGDDDNVDDTITKTINTNLIGLVRVTREAYKLMKKSDDYGMIINIGSILGHSNPFWPYFTNVYPGTKYAVRAVSESLRQELIKFNDLKVRVCELCPGVVETEIFEVGKWRSHNVAGDFLHKEHLQVLRSADISETVLLVLSLPYNVNVSQIIVKPVGETF